MTNDKMKMAVEIFAELFPYEKRAMNIPYSNLQIEKLNFGFLVIVGCQRAAMTEIDKILLIVELWAGSEIDFHSLWYTNPNEFRKEATVQTQKDYLTAGNMELSPMQDVRAN